jgi:CBS domain-containing protein
MHVQDFMTTEPVACETSDRVEDAARLMRERGVGCVIVLDKGKIVGLVTDRDIVTKCVGVGLTPSLTAVNEVMTPNPATVTLDDTLFSIIDTLRSAGVVRRVPVVNAKKELIGLVSISDLAVVAKDLIDAVLLEDTRHSLSEVRGPSGGKRVKKVTRSPTNAVALPHHEFVPVTKSAVPLLKSRGGDPTLDEGF